ncbi:MAG: hypothetical protein ACO29O_00800 [Chitinophagaceae bacterium]
MMQSIKRFFCFLTCLISIGVKAQSVFLPQGSKEYILLDRLEIKKQKDTVLNFSTLKPFSRKLWVERLQTVVKDSEIALTSIDRYNIKRSLLNNLEWVDTGSIHSESARPLFKYFFNTPANFVFVKEKDFTLIINPVLYLQAGSASDIDQKAFVNTRGISTRMLIAKKIGVYSTLTENQERGPAYFQARVRELRAVPGAGLYQPFKGGGFDYFDATGGVTFNAAKFIDVQFGYDRQFIGQGYRSLFLSDQAHSYLFANLNLKVWRLNYVSKFMRLTSNYVRGAIDTLYPTRFATIHHISFNAPKWLTIGLFESIAFGRTDGFELAYLNPAIFLRPMEQDRGSSDNALVGVDFKMNLLKKAQIYGQVNFDEFKLHELLANNGWYANKWALQLGGKLIDALKIKNLDMQAELNLIRPFTYSHWNGSANYSNYNQPLAHPLMSNVKEFIYIVRYQPQPKWYMQGKIIYWNQGSDKDGLNYGNNLFKSSYTRVSDYGFHFGAGKPLTGLFTNLWLAYEWKENLFIEANCTYRKLTDTQNSGMFTLGIRWNIQRREYDY